MTVVPHYVRGTHPKIPQWVPETLDRAQPYRYCFSLQIPIMESYIVLSICTE